MNVSNLITIKDCKDLAEFTQTEYLECIEKLININPDITAIEALTKIYEKRLHESHGKFQGIKDNINFQTIQWSEKLNPNLYKEYLEISLKYLKSLKDYELALINLKKANEEIINVSMLEHRVVEQIEKLETELKSDEE